MSSALRLLILAVGVLATMPSIASALCAEGKWKGWRASLSVREADDPGSDLYNGLLWLGAAAGVQYGASPPAKPRWRDNGFDDSVRNALRADTAGGRSAAATASDVLLLTAMLTPLVVDAGGKAWLGERDCDLALDLATDWVETMSLTLLITQSTKAIAGRERPNSNCFRLDIPCGDDDSRASFFSGHTSLASAGAGLTCANSIRRRLWGDGIAARALPCALGTGAAVATGFMRINADKHWFTDVLTGWAVGALIGFFDTSGPVDWLQFAWRGQDGRVAARGIVLPYASAKGVGAGLSLRF